MFVDVVEQMRVPPTHHNGLDGGALDVAQEP